eukprot:TRINITY_DN42064_c0_g2_i4.p1 TRINITY_DN42064_c0_g2~~TRINITY_DN42064_c0_g2_i4.p1  ORF type:complete len:142 (-),score=4.05 TRINITY_DN42064_c0_g2_i4:22-447(-)
MVWKSLYFRLESVIFGQYVINFWGGQFDLSEIRHKLVYIGLFYLKVAQLLVLYQIYVQFCLVLDSLSLLKERLIVGLVFGSSLCEKELWLKDLSCSCQVALCLRFSFLLLWQLVFWKLNHQTWQQWWEQQSGMQRKFVDFM